MVLKMEMKISSLLRIGNRNYTLNPFFLAQKMDVLENPSHTQHSTCNKGFCSRFITP